MSRPRKFCQSLLLLLLLGAAGYLSRRYPQYLWLPIRKRTGDALWASCIFMLIALLRPKWSTFKIAVITLLISYTIEFSQIYHRPWIDAIRATLFGRLVLGTTFFWLDQVAYTVGVAFIAPIDHLFILHCRRPDDIMSSGEGNQHQTAAGVLGNTSRR